MIDNSSIELTFREGNAGIMIHSRIINFFLNTPKRRLCHISHAVIYLNQNFLFNNPFQIFDDLLTSSAGKS